MPVLGEAQATHIPTTLLLLGDTKAGKTDYAMKVAESGYDVLYIDGDVAAPTLNKLSPEAKNRVFYLPVHDYVDANGDYQNLFAEFIVTFTTGGKVLWNDTLGRPFDNKTYIEGEGGHEVWEIRPAFMDTSCVCILDSWTRLTHSIITWKADDLNVDLLEMEKLGREIYTGAGHKASQFLKLLTRLRSHLVVIGHPREYVKRSAPKGSKGEVKEKDMKIDWIQMVPQSTSNPHGLTIGAAFSDIGWIDVSGGGHRTIDFRPSADRVIGGAINTSGKVDELKLAGLLSGPGENTRDKWLTRWPNGTYVPLAKKPPVVLGKPKPSDSPAVEGADPAPPAKVSGLSALAGLRAQGVQR